MSRRAREAFERGYAYFQAGQFDLAIEAYNVAIDCEYDPISWIYTNRGLIYMNKGNYAQALEDFNTAIRLDPNTPYPYINRALTYSKLGKIGEAEADYRKVLQLPDFYSSHAYAREGLQKLATQTSKTTQTIATVFGPSEKKMAQVNSAGKIYSPVGDYWGYVTTDGKIYAHTDRHWGHVDAEGKFYQTGGLHLGRVDADGKVYTSSEKDWGQVILEVKNPAPYTLQMIGGAAFILGLLVESFGSPKFL